VNAVLSSVGGVGALVTPLLMQFHDQNLRLLERVHGLSVRVTGAMEKYARSTKMNTRSEAHACPTIFEGRPHRAESLRTSSGNGTFEA
jgi:hypothetical protein